MDRAPPPLIRQCSRPDHRSGRNHPVAGYFNGQIDDVRFYDGEMNSTLVGQLYGNGNGDFNRLKIKAAGTVTLTATQPGRWPATPLPHRPPSLQLSISPTRRSPLVPCLTSLWATFNFIPTAVASSGLDVVFTSSTALVAEVQSDGRTIKDTCRRYSDHHRNSGRGQCVQCRPCRYPNLDGGLLQPAGQLPSRYQLVVGWQQH